MTSAMEQSSLLRIDVSILSDLVRARWRVRARGRGEDTWAAGWTVWSPGMAAKLAGVELCGGERRPAEPRREEEIEGHGEV